MAVVVVVAVAAVIAAIEVGAVAVWMLAFAALVRGEVEVLVKIAGRGRAPALERRSSGYALYVAYVKTNHVKTKEGVRISNTRCIPTCCLKY